MAAEHQTDEIILSNFFKDRSYRGILIEVGAAGPEYLSMGSAFRNLGWLVIAVEPNPDFCDIYREKNIDVLQYACGEDDKDDVPFYVVKSVGAQYEGGEVSYESFSSLGVEGKYLELQKTVATETREIRVKLRKLDTLLQEYYPEVCDVDILSVDVEGHELSVLRGFSINRFRPKVMVIENLFNLPEYNSYIEQFGYERVGIIGPNEIYLSKEFKLHLISEAAGNPDAK
jgi:FkbM family methyltransferase